MLSKEALSELEKQKNPLLKECFDELKRFLDSPHLESYLTLQGQIEDFNSQLTIKPEEKKKRVIGNDQDGNVIEVDWMPGKIDLFADKDFKEFDRSFKYMIELPSLLDALDKIRKKISPEEMKGAANKKKVDAASGVAI